MALDHLLPGQAVDVLPLGPGLAAHRTTALFKSTDLELIRLVLRAGASLPPHSVPGEITIQCIEGVLEVHVDGQAHDLRAGQLMYLRGGSVHDLRARTDASALVTISVRSPARA